MDMTQAAPKLGLPILMPEAAVGSADSAAALLVSAATLETMSQAERMQLAHSVLWYHKAGLLSDSDVRDAWYASDVVGALRRAGAAGERGLARKLRRSNDARFFLSGVGQDLINLELHWGTWWGFQVPVLCDDMGSPGLRRLAWWAALRCGGPCFTPSTRDFLGCGYYTARVMETVDGWKSEQAIIAGFADLESLDESTLEERDLEWVHHVNLGSLRDGFLALLRVETFLGEQRWKTRKAAATFFEGLSRRERSGEWGRWIEHVLEADKQFARSPRLLEYVESSDVPIELGAVIFCDDAEHGLCAMEWDALGNGEEMPGLTFVGEVEHAGKIVAGLERVATFSELLSQIPKV